MTPEALWFPIAKQWIKQQIPRRQTLQIVLDRTQWHGHNLMMVSFVYPSFVTLAGAKTESFAALAFCSFVIFEPSK
jgi:hypothetical protein